MSGKTGRIAAGMRRRLMTARLYAAVAAAWFVLAAGARVEWIEKDHDFGTMKEEAGPKGAFSRFVNLGPDTVSIFNVRPSCGCTRGDWDDSPVAPGDTATVSYAYDPHLMPGKFDKSVKVMLSDGSRHTIRIRGNVVGTPESLSVIYPLDGGELKLSETSLNLGETAFGRKPLGFVNAYFTSADTVRPSALSSTPAMTVEPDSPAAGPGDVLTFTIAYDTSKGGVYGPVEASARITLPDGRGDATLPVSLYVLPDSKTLMTLQGGKNPVCELPMKLLDLGVIGNAEKRRNLTAEFSITNAGKGALDIYRIVTPRKGISVVSAPSRLKPGKKGTVKLEIDPDALPAGPMRENITILSSDPRSPRLELPVAYMKEGPAGSDAR